MIQVAGVRYTLSQSGTIWSDFLSAYDPSFRKCDKDQQLPDLEITFHIRHEDLPDVDTMNLLSKGPLWSVFRYGESYCITYTEPCSGSVFWRAVFDREARNVDIHIGKGMADNPCEPNSYYLDQILLSFRLASHNGMLIHSAGFGIKDKGMIFTGHSGAGKSTLSKLLSCSSSCTPLSDEKVVARHMKDRFTVFGTPWFSDAEIIGNSNIPLKAVFFLHHSPENKIIPITPKAVLKKLIPHTAIPWYDPKAMEQILDFCGVVSENIPGYDLYFKPDESAVETLLAFSEKL